MMTVESNLCDRHFDKSLHRVWIDEDEGVATFPLWNLSGQMVGYQQYRPDGEKKLFNNPREGRYFTHRKNKAVGVWGLEAWHLSNVLFITEGVFDAARITSKGYSAIATTSNDLDKTHQAWLYCVRSARPTVAVCDGDKAGLKLSKYSERFHVMPSGEDLGDASDDYVNWLIAKEVDYED